jgi:hypothetical protein
MEVVRPITEMSRGKKQAGLHRFITQQTATGSRFQDLT